MRYRGLEFAIFLGIIWVVLPGSHDARAFDLNKMMEKMQQLAPSPEKSRSGSSGGLGGLLSGGGGMFGAPSSGGSTSTKGGGKDYTHGSIIPLICGETKDAKELYADVGEEELNSWANRVANDFGTKSHPEVQIIFQNLPSPGGLGWARGLKFYLATEKPTDGAFSSTKINNLLESFTDKSEMRSVIAGKIKRAISDEGLEDEERSDAKFAYALIMGHYNKHHKKQGYAESLLKASEEAENLGALYVLGRRMYRGEGVPKDVNEASLLIQHATGRVLELLEENDEMPGDRWQEPDKLEQWLAKSRAFHAKRLAESAEEAEEAALPSKEEPDFPTYSSK